MPTSSSGGSAPLLQVNSLRKSYQQRRWLSRKKYEVAALEGVDLAIARGTTLALVGESGSGKSTLARCLVRLEEPTSGEIWYEGRNLLCVSRAELRDLRRQIQVIFQDPAAALNPRFTAAEIVAEPLAIATHRSKKEQRERALDLMEQVELPRQAADRRAGEFSGGQRQRLAIARALALEPKLLILDEAFSALDLSIQAQIVNLLLDLQAARGLTYLYITHDLSLVGHLADEVAVMFRGQIVERAAPAALLRHPQHPHTRALVAACAAMDAEGPGPRQETG
ncbi:MAG: ABC transporter ATP-binding protein [Acidobacteria bacterium]|nr:ABC transporter ATP-binding protein [Acidobacteriota bacterium]